MRRIAFLVLVIGCPALAEAKEDTLEYIDLLAVEAVGEIKTQTYDERVNKSFVGTRELGGTLLGGGVGMRPVFRFANGVRLSLEVSGTWGRLRDGDPAWAYSTVTRAEFLTGLGYELTLCRLSLHTATMVGLDAMWLDAAPRFVLYDAAGAAVTPASSSLSRIDMRLGQQLGAHVQVASAVALFADGTLDYDGQWRVRIGIAIGRAHPRRVR
jgi:hypothetical protein